MGRPLCMWGKTGKATQNWSANQKSMLCTASMCSMLFLLLNLEACPLEKFLKLHVIYEIKSECILKSNHVGGNSYIRYTPILFIYNYFNQHCYMVTFTALNYPVTWSAQIQWLMYQRWPRSYCFRMQAIAILCSSYTYIELCLLLV